MGNALSQAKNSINNDAELKRIKAEMMDTTDSGNRGKLATQWSQRANDLMKGITLIRDGSEVLRP